MSKPRVVVLADRSRKKIADAVEKFLKLAGDRAEVAGEVDFTSGLPAGLDADYAFVFGGDGTMLQAGRMLAGTGIPAVGVNLGKLGFLTDFNVDEIDGMLEEILCGECSIEERILLKSTLKRKDGEENRFAVNDVVLSRGAGIRMLELRLAVDGDMVTTYRSDGLIISTPAGSTAYSLSAGGPVLTPNLKALIITPICPHTLTVRPLVVSAESELTVTLALGEEEHASVSIDGQSVFGISVGDELHVKRARRTWKVVVSKD